MRTGLGLLLSIMLLGACDDREQQGDDTDEPDDTVDTDVPTVACPEWYPDADQDGYGDRSAAPLTACTPPDAHVENAGDCDDGDAAVHPDAVEVCDRDNVDEDCSGAADDDDPAAIGLLEYWPDADGDLHGDSEATPALSCDPPEGWVHIGDDCDDAHPLIHPGVAYEEAPNACMYDEDGDGWGSMNPPGGAVAGTDCDDLDPLLSPGARELFGDDLDQDCDGLDLWYLADGFELGSEDPAVFNDVVGIVLFDSLHPHGGAWAAKISADSGAMRTVTVDASVCGELRWSFMGKQGSGAPEPGDFLQVQYFDGTDWITTYSWEGTGVEDVSYTLHEGLLSTPDALHASSALRLIGRGGDVGDADNFLVDDFRLECGGDDADDDGVPERRDCDDADADHWSDCGLCVDADDDGYGEGCDRGPDCDDADAAVTPGLLDPPGDGLDADCSGVDGDGFFEDFDSDEPNPVLWSDLGAARVTDAESSSGTRSLHLEGTAIATMAPFDTSTCDGLSWSYMGKRGPAAPEVGEHLNLEVWTGTRWVLVDAWQGNGADDAAFVARGGVITLPEARHAGFQLRLLSQGTSSDDWFVDDLSVECGPDADGDFMADGVDCAPDDPVHWSDCGRCLDLDGDQFGSGCDLGHDCDEVDPTIHPGAPEVADDAVDSDCDLLDDAGAGIADDFELGTPRSTAWEVIRGSTAIATNYAGAGAGSLGVYDTDAHIESVAFDTSACTGIVWRYLGKRGGPAPTGYDWLELEYFDGTDWVLADSWAGVGSLDPTFTERTGLIDAPGALHTDFKVRFTASSTDVVDPLYYVDDLYVTCEGDDDDGDGVAALFDCDDGDPAHWSDCGLCDDADGDHHGAFCDLGDDCNDADASVHPGALEVAGDGIDQDCDHFDAGQGLFDAFESGNPSPTVWSGWGGDVSMSAEYASDGGYSFELNGVGAIETVGFDATSCSEVVWFFDGKRGPPEPSVADVTVSWWDGAAWVSAYVWDGGESDPTFLRHFGTITDPAALSPTFRLKLESNGVAGADAFFVDQVGVGCGEDLDGDGLPLPLDCNDDDPDHQSDCDRCVDADRDGFGVDCDLGWDCDDLAASTHPGASDLHGDAVDQDCSLHDGPGFFDDFEDARPGVRWTAQAGVTYETDASWSGSTSLVLDGGGTAETASVDLSSCSSVFWSYYVAHRAADVGEELVVSWHDGANWVVADAFEGDGHTMSPFQHRFGVIDDPAALGADFRLKFDANSDAEEWYLDDLSFGCHLGDVDGDGFPANLDCDDGDPMHWGDCGLCFDADDDGFGDGCDLGLDCDDGDPGFHPGAEDLLGDDIDHDCSQTDGPGLFEDFEAGAPRATVWSSLRGGVTWTQDYAWSGAWSADLTESAIIETAPVDLSACADVFWSYRGKRGPQTVEREDALSLSWFDGTTWVEADVWHGNDSDDPDFVRRWGLIAPTAASLPAFRVQLSFSGTSTDDVFVDDLEIGCNLGDDDGDGVPRNVDCDDADDWHWSDCGLCDDADGDGYGTGCDLGDDCDDADPTIHPSAYDEIGDFVDADCGGTDGPGFVDDFERGFQSSIWDHQSQITYTADVAWSGTTSIEFHVDSVAETAPRDLSTCSGVLWAYRGLRNQYTEGGTLTVSYDDGAAWVPVDEWDGLGVTDDDFRFRWGTINDPLALSPEFRLQLASDHSSYQYTYVDDVRVECDLGDADGDGVPANLDCDDADDWHWFDCGLCVDADGDGFGMGCDLGDDCDDGDITVNPAGPADVAVDGVDSDCDTLDLLVVQDDFDTGASTLFTSLTGDLAVVTQSGIPCPAAACDDVLRLRDASMAKSLQFDTTACTTVGWSYQARRGPSDPPFVLSNLTLEWNGGAGWVVANVWGHGTDVDFVPRAGVITDPAAISATLAVRLVTNGDNFVVPENWFIDDFRVGCAD